MGPIAVHFWDYIIGFYICTSKRNYYGAYGYAEHQPPGVWRFHRAKEFPGEALKTNRRSRGFRA